MASETGQSRGGKWVLLGVIAALAIFGPGWYRGLHPRPQVNVKNVGPTALAVVHDGDTSGVEAGTTLSFRCEVGDIVELIAPAGSLSRSVKVNVPEAPDRQIVTLEVTVDGTGALRASWKGP